MGAKKAAEGLKTALRQNLAKTESPIKISLQSQPKTSPAFKPGLNQIQPLPTFRSEPPLSNYLSFSLFTYFPITFRFVGHICDRLNLYL